MAFVHLHTHTEYSLHDGLLKLDSLIEKASNSEMPAIAITDQHNLFAAVKFYTKTRGKGIKPILGADIRIHHPDGTDGSSRLLLLVKNQQGYLNLSQLLSKAYQQGQHAGVPMIELSWLEGHTDGLICITGGPEGVFTEVLMKEAALTGAVNHFKTLFPDSLYLELVRVGRDDEDILLERTVSAAIKFDLPVVATNDVRFLEKADFEAHEARVCIGQGNMLGDPKRPKNYTPEQYLKSSDEMEALFADIPSAIENTVEIAKMCNFKMDLGNHYLPDFPVPEGMTTGEFLVEESFKGLEERFVALFPDKTEQKKRKKEYWDRLQIELDVINNMGFPGYFLIVADFIAWAKNNDVPVGPGRGSGAGSLVAYSLKITDLDPLAYDLLFERFLNPERVSLPDFDVDFCMVGRDKVIKYVAEHYGHDHVSQIITFGTMAAKGVIRDVGRILGFPYGLVDGLSKLIPFDLKMTLAKALEEEPKLQSRYDNEDDVRAIFDLALQLEGTVRNVGKHAGGVVIGPKPLPFYTPVYAEDNGASIVSQYDMNDVENVGMVKFDFLGLKTLTVIDYALKNIKGFSGEDIDINTIPLDDKKTYDLLKRAETTAVFQLESRGMKELIKKLQPDTFEDIVALVALFRPGPLNSGMVDDFVNRKHGRAEVSYPHPDLEEVLKPTYGVIVYQEQVMQIAQVLAGYSLGGADMLRRAMGKKKAEEMAKQRAIFTEGAKKAKNLSEEESGAIFDLMEKFAEYGFNKSHSAAYALIAYQTAWLKAHHPAAFMAGVMSADLDNTDKIVNLTSECGDMGLVVLPPDVNSSNVDYTVIKTDTIRYGLGAIKGVGTAVLENIVQTRKSVKAFKDIFDFCCQADVKKITSRVMKALIHAGAMDSIAGAKGHRGNLEATIPSAIKVAKQHQKNAEAGQVDLFSDNHHDMGGNNYELIKAAPLKKSAYLKNEKAVLGLYISGHPIDDYKDELAQFIPKRIIDLEAPESKGYNKAEKDVISAGLIIEMRTLTTKRGKKMAILTLDDSSGRIDVRMFPEVFDRYEAMLLKDALVVVKGKIAMDNFSGVPTISGMEFMTMTEARSIYLKALHVYPNDKHDTAEDGEAQTQKVITELQHVLQPFKNGGTRVIYHYRSIDNYTQIEFGAEWQVNPSDALLEALAKSSVVQKAVPQY